MLVAEKRTPNMLRGMKQALPTHIVDAEAAALRHLYESRSESISQAEFGEQFEIGSQGMVWQYLNGKRPLNLAAAIGFSRGLGVTISQFSPRLSQLIKEAATTERVSTGPMSKEAVAVLQIMQQQPEHEQKRLANIVRAAAITTPAGNDEVEQKMPATKKPKATP